MKKNVFVFLLASLCLGGITLLNSCLKGSNSMSKPSGSVSVIYASPGAPGLSVYFNTTSYGTIYYGQSGVVQPAAGNYTISFVNPASGDTTNQIQDSVQAAYYTMVLYDTTSPAKIMFFQDQAPQAQTQADVFVRFLQLSPDAGAVNVIMDSSEIYSNRTFVDNIANTNLSQYTTFSQGYHNFAVLSAATGDTLGKLNQVPLSAGGAYTIFLRGLAKSISDSLGLKLNMMQNAQVF